MLIENVNLLTGKYTLEYISKFSASAAKHMPDHQALIAIKGRTGRGSFKTIDSSSKRPIQVDGSPYSLSQNQLLQLVTLLISALTDLEKVLSQSIAKLKAEVKELEEYLLHSSAQKQKGIKKTLETTKMELSKDKKMLSHFLVLGIYLISVIKKPSLLNDGKQSAAEFLSQIKGLEKGILYRV